MKNFISFFLLLLPFLAISQNPVPYKGTGFLYFEDSTIMQQYVPLNATGSEEAILRTNSTTSNPHVNRYFQYKGPVLKWVEFLPGSGAGGGTVFRTSSVTPTTANVFPNGVPYKPNDELHYLRNGSVGFRNAGNTAWVKTSLDNGFNVPSGLRVIIPNTPPFYVPNLNKGNAFTINGVGDVSVSVPDSINFQSECEIFTFLIRNTTEDVIRIDFSSIGFKNKAQGAAVGEPVDSLLLSAGESLVIPFEIVNIGEITVLQTLGDWNRQWSYDYTDAAIAGLGDSLSIPANELVFGNGDGITSSSSLNYATNTLTLQPPTGSDGAIQVLAPSGDFDSRMRLERGNHSLSRAMYIVKNRADKGGQTWNFGYLGGDMIANNDFTLNFNSSLESGSLFRWDTIGGFSMKNFTSTRNDYATTVPIRIYYPNSDGRMLVSLPDSLQVVNPLSNSGLVSLRTALRSLFTNASGDLTAITTSQPTEVVITNGTGPIPNIDLGTVGISHGGTGSATQNFWDLTTNQVSAGTKRTTGALIVGSVLPITGVTLGQTSPGYFYQAPGTTAWSETGFDNSGGFSLYTFQNGGKQSTYLTAHGMDTGNLGSRLVFGTRVNGSPGNITNPFIIDGLQNLFNGATGTGLQGSVFKTSIGLEDSGSGSWTFGATTAGGGTYDISFNGASQITLVQGSGGVWVPSDRRFKYNIHALDISEEARQLDGVTYNLKSSKKPQIGFIAQDVQRFFPQAVEKNADGKLMVNYGMMSAPAWQLAKEVGEENELLKKEVFELSKRIESLEQQAGITPRQKMGFFKRVFGKY